MEPKIRFKGFEGEWEKVKLGDVAPISGGFAFQSKNFAKFGIPIVRISNILNSGVVGGDFAKYTQIDNDANYKLFNGDIVIAMSGATTGKVAVVETNEYLYQNQRVGKFTRTNKIDYKFLSNIVNSTSFLYALTNLLTSSAQPNASANDIDSIYRYIPAKDSEQQAIASYFTELDKQITLQTQKLEKLKQIKTASLQQMFV